MRISFSPEADLLTEGASINILRLEIIALTHHQRVIAMSRTVRGEVAISRQPGSTILNI